jgi:hypothetical protein
LAVHVTSLFGLPAHVLLVHIPIVLVPLVAIGVVLMCWRSMRRRLGWAVVAIAAVATGSTILAGGSGKALRRYVTRTSLVRQHTQIGGNLEPWIILLFVLVLAMVSLDWWTRRSADANSVGRASGEVQLAGRTLSAAAVQNIGLGLSAIAILVSGMSVYWLYRIGHSGAKASWSVVQQRIDKGQQIGGDQGH